MGTSFSAIPGVQCCLQKAADVEPRKLKEASDGHSVY